MPSHRFLFYTPLLERSAGNVTIDGEEHHHICNVLRLGAGAGVELTNGRGLIVSASLKDVTRSESVAEIIDVIADESDPVALTLAIALVRKDRVARAVEQCTELGMTECIPFVSPGSRVERFGSGTAERFKRVAVAAMKQSHRAHLPRVCAPVEFEELVNRVRGTGNAFVGAQGAPAMPSVLGAGALVVVGPEAGFGGAERAALEGAGAAAVSVSRHRLRSETAAVAMISAAARAIDSATSQA